MGELPERVPYLHRQRQLLLSPEHDMGELPERVPYLHGQRQLLHFSWARYGRVTRKGTISTWTAAATTLLLSFMKNSIFATRTLVELFIETGRKFQKHSSKTSTRGSFFRRRQGLLAVKFHDKRDLHVNMLSTIHSADAFLWVVRHDRSVVLRHTCIADYTRLMGGVYVSDQLSQYYPLIQRTVKWWKKLFFRSYSEFFLWENHPNIALNQYWYFGVVHTPVYSVCIYSVRSC